MSVSFLDSDVIWELNLYQNLSLSPLLFDIKESFLMLSFQIVLFLVCLKKTKSSFLYFCSFRTFSFNQDLIQDEIILSHECHSMLFVCKENIYFSGTLHLPIMYSIYLGSNFETACNNVNLNSNYREYCTNIYFYCFSVLAGFEFSETIFNLKIIPSKNIFYSEH